MEIFTSLFFLLQSLAVFFVSFSCFNAFLCRFYRTHKLHGGGGYYAAGHGPPTYPIIGCLISFYKNKTRLLDWYTELLTESESNTIVVQRLGAPRTIVTANPDNVEYMLKTNFSNFPKGKPFTEILGDFLGYGIFNVDGELWLAQRKLASHAFSTKSLREFVMDTLEEEVEKHLAPVLEMAAETEEVVDLQYLLRKAAFNMICKVSLGIDRCNLDPSAQDSPLDKAFDLASMICAKRGAAPLFLVWKVKKWLGIGSEKQLKDAVQEVHAYVAGIIQERKEMIEKTEIEIASGDQDLLSRLILAGHEEDVIRDMVISFILAGRDTTSAAMTWLFWLLSRHPDIEKEVVKEAAEKKTLMDYESLKSLNLLKACLCESMRLYPPVAWDSKHALYNDLLPDGTPVKAGDRVTYFPYGMGRMEALWGKDRFDFKPNRWFEGEGEMKEVCPFRFPVFQAGPRVCLGKEMAFIQMKYLMASILRRFEFRPVSTKKPVFVPLLTAHMAGGLKVIVRKRDR